MFPNKSPLIIVLLLLSAALFSCDDGSTGLGSTPRPELPQSQTDSPAFKLTPTPTPTPIPMGSEREGIESAYLTDTVTSAPPSESSLPSPVPSPETIMIRRSICSPLVGYGLDELPGILTREFAAPLPGTDDGHHGLDFAHWRYKDRLTLEGVPVASLLPGRVVGLEAGGWPYANMIIIESLAESLELFGVPQLGGEEFSLYTLYAHLGQPPDFAMEAVVSCGAALGQVGGTGNSGNPHLHIETRFGPAGLRFYGMVYYTTLSTAAERANYERWRFGPELSLHNPWFILAQSPASAP